MEDGDSSGISGTVETPQGGEATEEAHRPPRGKRPPETEINFAHFKHWIYGTKIIYFILLKKQTTKRNALVVCLSLI